MFFCRISSQRKLLKIAALLTGSLLAPSISLAAPARPIKTVFKIVLENHNWTQPSDKFNGTRQQVFKNPNAPYINSLVNGTSSISSQVAYAASYHNVLVTKRGDEPDIHPSEPNYIWSEAGSNLGVLNDNDPYQNDAGTHQSTTRHLSTYLTKAGKSWKAYQEDIDLERNAKGELTNKVKPKREWTVPLSSHAGTSPAYTNKYNGSHQYNYAAKHDPQVLFDDTSGGDNATLSNPQASHYAPLSQLQKDLADNSVANYNVITPDEYNDMHSPLTRGFTTGDGTHLSGEAARMRAADHFLARIIPQIMRSKAYQDDGMIEIWMDETEGPNNHGDDMQHTLPEIIISPDVHPNVNGKPYASRGDLTHSSTLKTMQEIFNVRPYLRHAGDPNVHDLSDLFAAGTIPGN